MNRLKAITAEAWLATGLALLGVLGVVFMSSLVAAPKVLFGRSLTAIAPSLFPTLVLGAMAVLAIALLVSLRHSLFAVATRDADSAALQRVFMLFGVMLFYALTMQPLGFFISSAMSMAAVGWLAGNRSIPQILLVSLISPVLLYLVATRGLAVSLPELSSIEFFYAGIFNTFTAAPEAGVVVE